MFVFGLKLFVGLFFMESFRFMLCEIEIVPKFKKFDVVKSVIYRYNVVLPTIRTIT